MYESGVSSKQAKYIIFNTNIIIMCCVTGINSFKVFQAYKDVFMIDDGEMLEVFKKTKELKALAQVHAENGHVIEQVQYLMSFL